MGGLILSSTLGLLSSETERVVGLHFFRNGARVRITRRVGVSRTRMSELRGGTLGGVRKCLRTWTSG